MLGTRVHAIQIPQVVATLVHWIDAGRGCRFVAVTGMHGVTEARRHPAFRKVLETADLVVPDGMPLVWMGRRRGFDLPRRVYGPELLQTFCRVTGPRYAHFFYGGGAGVAERLAQILHDAYRIRVAGCYAPPFRALQPQEDEAVTQLICSSGADLLWIGLSTPRQENWMEEHRHRLRLPVMVGVGAAFDFLTDRVKQAPSWMRENGLEWLFRLLHEPRRLWRRYLIYGSDFLWNTSLELLGLKRFS